MSARREGAGRRYGQGAQRVELPGTCHAAPRSSYLRRRRASALCDWRQRLPSPAEYYRRHLPGRLDLDGSSRGGWVRALCPFHDDHHPSLSINLDTGCWHCFACGVGGDLIAFHMRLTGRGFWDTVRELTGECS